MKKQILWLAAASALVAVPLLAAQAGDHKPMGDANGDGVVTRAEAQAAATAHFAKMDANKDGVLDQADHEAHRSGMQAKHFDALDTDGNGSISRAEWDAQAAKRAEKHGERHGKRQAADGEEGAAMRGHHGMARMMLAKADTNGDKAISQAEFQAAMLAHFDKADTDKDGQLSAAEQQAAHAAMRAMHGARHGAGGHDGHDAPDAPDGM